MYINRNLIHFSIQLTRLKIEVRQHRCSFFWWPEADSGTNVLSDCFWCVLGIAFVELGCLCVLLSDAWGEGVGRHCSGIGVGSVVVLGEGLGTDGCCGCSWVVVYVDGVMSDSCMTRGCTETRIWKLLKYWSSCTGMSVGFEDALVVWMQRTSRLFEQINLIL